MQKRRLANTQIEVSVLGLGTVKFGRNQGVKYPLAFNLPTDCELLQLLDVAEELGINLLDTAPAYGTSEERLGKLLQGKRSHWVLSTKVGETFNEGESSFDFSPHAISASVHRSLKRLQTDYLDIVLVHSNGDDDLLIEQDVFTTLADLKQAGKIRAYGMSTKTVSGGIHTIDHADLAMVTYHPAETEQQAVIAYALEKQKGIFIKKAFASGHLNTFATATPIEDALRFIFCEQGVTSVIVGTINAAHLRENAACAAMIT